jgi:mannose-1-phosphate guanylyltransferase
MGVQHLQVHLESLGSLSKEIQFIKEPIGRNTAPAIGLAAIYLKHVCFDSIMIIMPSDHAIPDSQKFLSDLKLAIEGAEKDYLVTFGIKPNRPETGYGYIKILNGSELKGKGNPSALAGYVYFVTTVCLI